MVTYLMEITNCRHEHVDTTGWQTRLLCARCLFLGALGYVMCQTSSWLPITHGHTPCPLDTHKSHFPLPSSIQYSVQYSMCYGRRCMGFTCGGPVAILTVARTFPTLWLRCSVSPLRKEYKTQKVSCLPKSWQYLKKKKCMLDPEHKDHSHKMLRCETTGSSGNGLFVQWRFLPKASFTDWRTFRTV